MKLLRLRDVRVSTGDVVFRESPWARLVAVVVCLSVAAIPLGVAWHERDLVWPWYAAGGVVLLFAYVLFRVFLRTLKPENWLVRLPATGGIVVKFDRVGVVVRHRLGTTASGGRANPARCPNASSAA